LPPPRIGISIGDSIAALHAVIGALMALHHRQANGGKGQIVDVALYEAVFNMMESIVPEYGVYGPCASAPALRCPASCRPIRIRARTAAW
jgi:formyl-CoA transferase